MRATSSLMFSPSCLLADIGHSAQDAHLQGRLMLETAQEACWLARRLAVGDLESPVVSQGTWVGPGLRGLE